MIFFHFIAGSYYKPRLRQHLHLHHHLRSTHRFPNHPQQPPSANPIPHIPIPPMTTVPTYAHRCNRLSPDAPCRNSSTLESLSAFFEVMQPDNQMVRHHFQKNERLFEPQTFRNQSGCISVKGCDELGMDGILGTTR